MINVKKVEKSIDTFLSCLTQKRNELSVLYKISQNWSSFVDSIFIKSTYPLKIERGRANTLLIAVCNNSVGSQFYYSKERLISRINLHFGYDIVSNVRIVLKSFGLSLFSNKENINTLLSHIEIPEAIRNVKDVDLQRNLLKLLCRVK